MSPGVVHFLRVAAPWVTASQFLIVGWQLWVLYRNVGTFRRLKREMEKARDRYKAAERMYTAVARPLVIARFVEAEDDAPPPAQGKPH